MKRKPKPKWVRELASARINKLLKLAEANKKLHPDKAKRYVELARKISMRYNVKIKTELKKKFCKKCSTFFTSDNVKTRIAGKVIIYICQNCGFKKKYGIKHEKTHRTRTK